MLEPDAAFVGAYCERLGSPAFLAEPINAATNLAFILAALAALVAARETRRDPAILALIALSTLIGIGSFLFHTIPNRITVLMDVLPIQGFILTYVWLATRRYLGQPFWISVGASAAFFLASGVFVAAIGSRTLGGSVGYLPALLALIGFGVAILRRGSESDRRAARALFAAAAVFAVSLTLRTLDMPLCEPVPFGLHFGWHVLNGVVLGILMLAAIRHQRGVATPTKS